MKQFSYGLRLWVLQRLSAVYMLLFSIFMAGFLLFGDINNYTDWREFMAGSVTMVACCIFFLGLFVHAWVGVRDVIMDYIHGIYLKLGALTLLAFGLLAMAFWILRIFLTIL